MPESSTHERIREELQAAQEWVWGEARGDALAPSLHRMAAALATLEDLRLPSGMEPFPTGPEVPRG